jgi:hypothetical protein
MESDASHFGDLGCSSGIRVRVVYTGKMVCESVDTGMLTEHADKFASIGGYAEPEVVNLYVAYGGGSCSWCSAVSCRDGLLRLEGVDDPSPFFHVA